MGRKWKVYTDGFKAAVALAAIKGDRTVAELAKWHPVHPTLMRGWKKQLVANAELDFASGAMNRSPFFVPREAEGSL